MILAIRLNDRIGAAEGLVSILSFGFSIYISIINILYIKNNKFYIFVHKLFLLISRSHTFWNLDLDFVLDPDKLDQREGMLPRIEEMFREGKHGSPRVQSTATNRLDVLLDNTLGLTFISDDVGIHAGFDRELLVPTHLYSEEQRRLRKITNDLYSLIQPLEMRCGLQVRFRDVAHNPYFGYFVNRVPAELLQDFLVRFRLHHDSTCRIEAQTDCVGLQSKSLAEMFEAMTQVLSLEAFPIGAKQ